MFVDFVNLLWICCCFCVCVCMYVCLFVCLLFFVLFLLLFVLFLFCIWGGGGGKARPNEHMITP